ncbi:MAG: hypothetical protein ACREHG_02745 [Candidatus Saccharimonadales bacterium]
MPQHYDPKLPWRAWIKLPPVNQIIPKPTSTNSDPEITSDPSWYPVSSDDLVSDRDLPYIKRLRPNLQKALVAERIRACKALQQVDHWLRQMDIVVPYLDRAQSFANLCLVHMGQWGGTEVGMIDMAAQVQRCLRDLFAMRFWASEISGNLKDPNFVSTVTFRTRGAFTRKVAEMEYLFRAGIPVWYYLHPSDTVPPPVNVISLSLISNRCELERISDKGLVRPIYAQSFQEQGNIFRAGGPVTFLKRALEVFGMLQLPIL